MDTTTVKDLRCRCRIGFRPHELDTDQVLRITFSYTSDTTAAAQSDDVRDAVDYREVTHRVREAVEGSRQALIETVAQRVAEVVLGFGVEWVRVTVEKPGALRHARSVQVAVERSGTHTSRQTQ